MAREVVVGGVGHAAVVPARRVMGPGSPRPRRSGRDDDETISDVIPGGRRTTRDPPPPTFRAPGLPFPPPPVASLLFSRAFPSLSLTPGGLLAKNFQFALVSAGKAPFNP